MPTFNEDSFRALRIKLDGMGYHQPFSYDSLPLLEKLVADFSRTCERERHFEDLVHSLTEKCSQLEQSISPYKVDNMQLLKQNNDLHKVLLEERNKLNTEIRDLSDELFKLENAYSDLEFINTEQATQLGELQEMLSACQDPKILKHTRSSKQSIKQGSQRSDLISKTQRAESEQTIKSLEQKITSQEVEIKRLVKALEERSPIQVCVKKCSCHYQDLQKQNPFNDVFKMKDETLHSFETVHQKLCSINSDLEAFLKKQTSLFDSFKGKDTIKTCKDKLKTLSQHVIDYGDYLLELDSCYDILKKDCEFVNKLFLTWILEAEPDLSNTNKIVTKIRTEVQNGPVKEQPTVSHTTHKTQSSQVDFKSRDDNISNPGPSHQKHSASSKGSEPSLTEFIQKLKHDCMRHTNSQLSHQKQLQQLSEWKVAAIKKLKEKEEEIATLKKRVAFLEPCKATQTSNEIQETRNPEDSSYKTVMLLNSRVKELEAYIENEHSKQKVIETLKHEAKQKDREIQELNNELSSLQKTKEKEVAELHGQIGELESKIFLIKKELHCLKDAHEALVSRSEMFSNRSNYDSNSFQKMKHNYEETLNSRNDELRKLHSELTLLKKEKFSVNEQTKSLNRQIDGLSSECHFLRTHLEELRLENERVKITLGAAEEELKIRDSELKSTMEHMKRLENEKSVLHDMQLAHDREKQTYFDNLKKLDKQKDTLQMHIDEKCEKIAALEGELMSKSLYVQQLQRESENTRSQLSKLREMTLESEGTSRQKKKEVEDLRRKLEQAISSRDNLIIENRRLQGDMDSLVQDNKELNIALNSARQENDKLIQQLKTYVEEVRRVEILLQHKEMEREELIDQFRALSVEASALESNNYSLESNARSTKSSMNRHHQKIQDLENEIQNKTSEVKTLESKISKLTHTIAKLESSNNQLVLQMEELQAELQMAQEFRDSSEKQNDRCTLKLKEKESLLFKLEEELMDVRKENKELHAQLASAREEARTIESVLERNRHETISKSFANEDLSSKVDHLENIVHRLESNLTSTESSLDKYKSALVESQNEIKMLKRKVTNEQFERVRSAESLRSTNTTW